MGPVSGGFPVFDEAGCAWGWLWAEVGSLACGGDVDICVSGEFGIVDVGLFGVEVDIRSCFSLVGRLNGLMVQLLDVECNRIVIISTLH